MKWLARLVAVLAFLTATRADGQHSVEVEGPRRSRATAVIRRAIAGPYDLMLADTGRQLVLPRSSELQRSVIILGGDVALAGTVRGDVIVVGGDLFLRPAAHVEGTAAAIGGAVYGSTLALVNGEVESVRDETFDVTRHGDAFRLEYRYIGAREPAVELPLLEGLRIPSYDRVNGVSVPWGPILRPAIRVELDPTVTYRSHIGEWDPGVIATYRLDEQYQLRLDARRGTFTNDAWIHSTPINTFNVLVGGKDTRNYYRADRGELEIRRFDAYPNPLLELERFAGISIERAWSVGAATTLGRRPWSFGGGSELERIARPNPPIERGRISSAFVGAVARYRVGDVRSEAIARVEVPWETPENERFAQLTFDGSIRFPTFGLQRFRADLHVIATIGDTAPPQRFGYLGGSGTLPTIDIPLLLGGDQLFHLDSRYEVPVQVVRIPFLGSPTIAVRHRIGSAGEQGLPKFIQNVGPVLTWSFVRVEHVIDPATREGQFSAGLSFAR